MYLEFSLQPITDDKCKQSRGKGRPSEHDCKLLSPPPHLYLLDGSYITVYIKKHEGGGILMGGGNPCSDNAEVRVGNLANPKC